MHVRFWLVWQFVIHHMRHLINIDPTGRNVRGNQHRGLRRLKCSQRLLSLILALIAVDCRRANADLIKISLQFIGPVLCASEHDHASHRLVFQQVYEQVPLLPLRKKKYRLRHGFSRRRLRRGLHFHRIAQH